MTRILGELLGVSQPQFSALIQRLESAAGRPSTDIRFTHDIAQIIRDALPELQLDAHDSTNREIYAALRNKVSHDEGQVLHALGAGDGRDMDLTLSAIQRFTEEQVAGKKVIAVKPSTLRRLMKFQPPKKTMKQLHYRSVDSMLKHESVASLYSAAWICESEVWRKKFIKQYTQLQPSDFEERSIEIFQPQAERWKVVGSQASAERKHNVISFLELGVVTILPAPQYMSGFAIANIMLVLQACNDVLAVSSYLKLQRMTPQFGQEVARIAASNNSNRVWSTDQEVSWHTLHAYFSRKNSYLHYFEPYIQAEDMQILHPEALLATLHPSLSFWQTLSHSMKVDAGKVLSFNVLDVAINYCNNLEYAQAAIDTARHNLWQELFMRYLNQDIIEKRFLPSLQPIPQEIDSQSSY